MKKQRLPIECAENGRKAGRQVLLKLLIIPIEQEPILLWPLELI